MFFYFYDTIIHIFITNFKTVHKYIIYTVSYVFKK